jgi:hypothetical protein
MASVVLRPGQYGAVGSWPGRSCASVLPDAGLEWTWWCLGQMRNLDSITETLNIMLYNI